MAEHASQLYARNVQALLELMTGEEARSTLDFDDEIIAGACVTRDGEIVHEGAKAGRGRRPPWSSRCSSPNLAILVLAGFVGFEVISKVPEHAAHAADVGHERDPRDRGARRPAGASGCRGDGTLNKVLLVIAIAFGTINVVGGFLVTDRMLGMFKAQAGDAEAPTSRRQAERADRSPRRSCRTRTSSTSSTSSPSSLFITACAGCAGRATAVRGNRIAAVGMAIAVVATLLTPRHRATGA